MTIMEEVLVSKCIFNDALIGEIMTHSHFPVKVTKISLIVNVIKMVNLSV